MYPTDSVETGQVEGEPRSDAVLGGLAKYCVMLAPGHQILVRRSKLAHLNGCSSCRPLQIHERLSIVASSSDSAAPSLLLVLND